METLLDSRVSQTNSLRYKTSTNNETPSINWALSNSLNTYNRHSDWHKLEVYATNDDWHKLKVYATNDEEIAAQVVMTIRNAYFAEFEKLLIRLQQLKAEGTL